jgi:hypothetical protein
MGTGSILSGTEEGVLKQLKERTSAAKAVLQRRGWRYG